MLTIGRDEIFNNALWLAYGYKREIDMDVLKRINTLRIDRGWSVYKLANESGLAQSTIINMFSRETLPSITTLENICSAFGISMAEFFCEEATAASGSGSRREFIRLYESLSPGVRDSIFHLMQELSKENKT